MATLPNPCLCGGTYIVDPPPPGTSGCGENCICLCDIVVDVADWPNITQTGTLNLATYKDLHDLGSCGIDQKYWRLISYDPIFFETVSISLAGIITWKARITARGVGQLIFRMDCGNFAATATFTTGTTNPCLTTVCPEGFECDPSDGDCVAETSPHITTTESC